MSNDDRAEKTAARAFSSLRDRASKLIGWYKVNRPSVDVVRVTEDEYKMLKQFPAIASGCGFHRESGEFVLSGFKILPPPLSTSHTSSEGTT
jgi:hypothetical protein